MPLKPAIDPTINPREKVTPILKGSILVTKDDYLNYTVWQNGGITIERNRKPDGTDTYVKQSVSVSYAALERFTTRLLIEILPAALAANKTKTDKKVG